MKNRNFIQQSICFFVLQCVVFTTITAQDYSKLADKADTLNFSLAKSGNWQLLNSYVEVNKSKDSVLLELIVFTDKKDIDWKQEQYIGKIKYNKFFSKKTDRISLCYLLNDVYRLKVDKDGKCYFSLEKGNPPSGVPAVIPLRVSYKL